MSTVKLSQCTFSRLVVTRDKVEVYLIHCTVSPSSPVTATDPTQILDTCLRKLTGSSNWTVIKMFYFPSQDLLPLRGGVGQLPAQLPPAEQSHSIRGEDLHDSVCISGGQSLFCGFISAFIWMSKHLTCFLCLLFTAGPLHPACHYYQRHLHGLLLPRC